MFTIIENYKTLMKMCVSASMSLDAPSAPEGPSFGEAVAEVRGVTAESLRDCQASTEYLASGKLIMKGAPAAAVKDVQEMLVHAGYDIGNFGPARNGVDGDFGGTATRVVKQFQADHGLAVDGKIGNNTYSALVAASGAASYTEAVSLEGPAMSGATTTAAAERYVAPVVEAGDAMSQYLTDNGNEYLINGVYYDKAAYDDGLYGDMLSENIVSMETGSAVSAGVESHSGVEYSKVLDINGNEVALNTANALDVPANGNYEKGQTYKFNVNGTTEYAVWIDVRDKYGNVCPSLVKSVPLLPGQEGLEEVKYFVCEGAYCVACDTPVQPVDAPQYIAAPPVEYIPTTPIVEIPAPAPAPAPEPVYTQPIDTYIAPAPEPKTLPAVISECLTVESYLMHNTIQDINSSFYDTVILNPTQEQYAKYSSNPRLVLNRGSVDVKYPGIGGVLMTKKIPAIITLKQKNTGNKFDAYSVNKYGKNMVGRRTDITDLDRSESFTQGEPYTIHDDARCASGFDIYLPTPVGTTNDNQPRGGDDKTPGVNPGVNRGEVGSRPGDTDADRAGDDAGSDGVGDGND